MPMIDLETISFPNFIYVGRVYLRNNFTLTMLEYGIEALYMYLCTCTGHVIMMERIVTHSFAKMNHSSTLKINLLCLYDICRT